jgi:hypothetical protein
VRRVTALVEVVAIVVLVTTLGIAARAPVAFKTIAALTDAPLPELVPQHPIDIARIVRAIPDRGPEGTSDMVYAAHPAVRYQRSVVEGFGNCSNLVKGLTWKLLRDGHDFEVVYVFPIETFLMGRGHTILRANLALPEGPRVGLVDVAAAAIPRTADHVLDVGDFASAVPAVYLDPLRPESEDWSYFYSPEFLGDSVIGRTSSAETARWFHVLDTMYLDLGLPEKLDKMVYMGIGVLLGQLAPIHVAHLESLRSRHPHQFAAMNATRWGMRAALLVVLGCGLYRLGEALKRRSQKRRISASSVERSSTPILL